MNRNLLEPITIVAIWLDSGLCNNRVDYNYVSENYGEGIRAEISFHSYIGYNIVENTEPCTSAVIVHAVGWSRWRPGEPSSYSRDSIPDKPADRRNNVGIGQSIPVATLKLRVFHVSS